jgi:hypothetical protein
MFSNSPSQGTFADSLTEVLCNGARPLLTIGTPSASSIGWRR